VELNSFALAVTGGAVTLFGNSLLENIKSRYSLHGEQYKIQLKKSEFFFQEQFKASLQFGAFFNSILPEKEHFLMEWEDAARYLADHFEEYKFFLNEFVSSFDILFSQDIINLVHQCNSVIISYNTDHDQHQMNEYSEALWEDKKWAYGDEFYTAVKKAHEAIKKTIWEQVKY